LASTAAATTVLPACAAPGFAGLGAADQGFVDIDPLLLGLAIAGSSPADLMQPDFIDRQHVVDPIPEGNGAGRCRRSVW